MTSTIAKVEIVKQDSRGRVRVSRERREALLSEFENSALSASKFARLAGIRYSTFANWVQKRRQRRGQRPSGEENSEAAQPGPVRLFEAVVESSGGSPGSTPPASLPAPSAAGLLLELPGGCRMLIESPIHLQMAAELVSLIAQRPRARC